MKKMMLIFGSMVLMSGAGLQAMRTQPSVLPTAEGMVLYQEFQREWQPLARKNSALLQEIDLPLEIACYSLQCIKTGDNFRVRNAKEKMRALDGVLRGCVRKAENQETCVQANALRAVVAKYCGLVGSK